jgi:CRISPR type I-E-associated protein CasB/Cse2
VTETILEFATTTPAAESDHPSQALAWWQYHLDSRSRTYDPGTRARLRRCDSPADAAAIPAAVSLARRVGAFSAGADDQRIIDALNLARVLAHVRTHEPGPPMRVAGWKKAPGDRKESDAGEDRPLLSGARFRRLLATGPDEEQVAAFVRLIAILDGKVDVTALSRDFLNWSHPWKGERVRRQWAEDYFAARIRDYSTVKGIETPNTEEGDA